MLMDGFSKFSRIFVLGDQNEPRETANSKMVLLRSQFALLAVFLGVLYASIVTFRKEYQFLPWHSLLIIGGYLAFYLNKKRKYTLSTLTLFVVSNTFIYLFSAVGRPQDGMFFYFFISNTLSIILIGYKHYRTIVLLVLMTVTLAVVAYLYPVSPIPLPRVTPGIEKTIFLINMIVSLLFGSYVIVTLMRENMLVEDQLIKSHRELKQRNEELDSFVYSASHDMKAPLSSLLGLVTVAEMANTPQETSACLGMMRERIGVMEGFLKEITDYSRNVRTRIEKKPVDVHACVNDILNGLKFLSQRSKIEITVSVPPETILVTDETRFKIILNNLISNAIKYFDPAKERPYITIHTQHLKDHLHLSVADNGLGIGCEHKQLVFDMFYRATTYSEGSGLGLYIVSETVKKLGGTISLQSEEGKGSVFTLQLPMD